MGRILVGEIIKREEFAEVEELEAEMMMKRMAV